MAKPKKKPSKRPGRRGPPADATLAALLEGNWHRYAERAYIILLNELERRAERMDTMEIIGGVGRIGDQLITSSALVDPEPESVPGQPGQPAPPPPKDSVE